MNSIFTKVIHGLKNHFNLTHCQYYVADTIDVLSQNSRWCYKSKANIARDLFISERAVGLAIKRLIKDGLVEKKSDSPKHLQTTIKWIEAKEIFSKRIFEGSYSKEEVDNKLEKGGKGIGKKFSNTAQNFPKNKKSLPTRIQEEPIDNKEKIRTIESYLNF